MKATIIGIGDELLIGQVVNTNAAFIAQKLNSVGIEIVRTVTVGDSESEIISTFGQEFKGADVVIITGGLGPTHDDITRSAVCKFFDVKLVRSEEARRNVETFLANRSRQWSEAAENQTFIPEGAEVIQNKYGTAPGELIVKDNKYFIVMPGVPYEMESMMEDFVIPYFQSKIKNSFILHRTLMTTGIPESELAGRLGNLDEIVQGQKLAFLPSPAGVRLRITVSGSDKNLCEDKIHSIESHIRARADKYIFGVDDEPLEEALGKLLMERRQKIAVAESCTGGLIAHKITNVSGSSRYLERAVVAYSNKSKIDLLHVPEELITKHGAVSREVAEAMAAGIMQISGVDIGLSTTGIAGPTGGSTDKPTGLVWIGYSDIHETIAMKFNFGDGRIRVKERAAQAAIDLARRKLLRLS